MSKIKKVFNNVIELIAGCGVVCVIFAWIVTILSLTFGLAIWSTQWLWSLI